MDRLRNFGFILKDVSRLSALNVERHVAELDLSLTECKVLAHLQRNEGVTQVRLAELSDVDQMTLVRVLDRMEADGWVERGPHPTDRRARCLFLRPLVRPILQKMWQLGDRARAAALAGLSAAEAEQLMSLLEKVHANLSALALTPAAEPTANGAASAEKLGRRRRPDRTAARPPPAVTPSAGNRRKVKL